MKDVNKVNVKTNLILIGLNCEYCLNCPPSLEIIHGLQLTSVILTIISWKHVVLEG